MTQRRLEFEITDHGVEHSQYFQGCGVAFTKYSDVVTGIGDSAFLAGCDAFEDADIPTSVDATDLIQELAALSRHEDAHEDCDPSDHDECEVTHHVSIRWRVVESAEVRP